MTEMWANDFVPAKATVADLEALAKRVAELEDRVRELEVRHDREDDAEADRRERA